jgi:demethylmenaquinone methyltransferase/2-methoxy-6-polyprenyl-1,4-benzoquinol methylase
MTMLTLAEKQAFFNDAAPRWILDSEIRSARLEHIFQENMLPLAAPILDVGGGTGILLPLLRRHAKPDAHIVELEVAMDMLRTAKTLHDAVPRIDYMQADGQRLPLASGTFGSIHCFSVFPHFHEPLAALAEFRRCLRPGGALCIMHLMGHEELNNLHRSAGRVVAEDVLPPVETLADTVRRTGFDILHAEERPDLYLLIAQRRG